MKKQFVVVEEEKAQYIVSNPPVFTDGNWFQMFKKFAMRQASISPAARAIFNVMMRYINGEIRKDTGQAVCWPSYAELHKCTGIKSHHTIERAIQELTDLGYIQDRYFDFPPKTTYDAVNVQKVWIYSLGEIDDNATFNRRAKQTRISRAISNRQLKQKFG